MIRFIAGAAIGVATSALAQDRLPLTFPSLKFESAVNVAFDPDGKGKALKVDADGYVLANCVR